MGSDDSRRRFLDERREVSRDRYDTLHAAGYDEHWGALPADHTRWLGELAARLGPGASVLDAACGTGRAWPPLLDAGLAVTGADQSRGMLDMAARKHPGVATRVVTLQALADAADLVGAYDGLTCLDALENIGPEDWPAVLDGFARVLKPAGWAYVTVELPGPAEIEHLAAPAGYGAPVLPGELYDGIGYHYYPARSDALAWLADAGFSVADEAEAEVYWHLLLRSR